MKDNVYYVPEEDAYVVAKTEDSELFLTAVYADHVVDLDRVIAAFGNSFREIKLGFTQLNDEQSWCRRVK